MEIIKTSTGNFRVMNNGEYTGVRIFNGCAGMSGRGSNVYGVEFNGKNVLVGSLARAKRFALEKAAALVPAAPADEWVPDENPDGWLEADVARRQERAR